MKAFTILITLSSILWGYTIGPDDTLIIEVLEDPSYNKSLRVDSDGNISLPFLGKVNVSGLTSNEISDKIKKLFIEKQIFVNPNVSVHVKSFDSKKVLVLGEVKIPGSYKLKSDLTVLDIITKAGGLKERGSKHITLIRKKFKTGNETISIKINIDDILNGKNLHQNIYLKDGDVINVTRSFF